jgi:hypothetical protein
MRPIPTTTPPHPDLARLSRRDPKELATFILTLAGDDNGIGAYVRGFVDGGDVALLDTELRQIREGEREYDYRHRRGDVHLRRLDHVLDLVELVILPADTRAAFEFLARVIEADGEIAEHTGDAWLQPTFDRACELCLAAAKGIPGDRAKEVLARLAASDGFGLRGRLINLDRGNADDGR